MPWMRVKNAPEWADLLERRPCGCYRHEMGNFSHWWRYNRLRYWCRCAGGWKHLAGIWWAWEWREVMLDVIEWLTPFHFATEMIGYHEAQERLRQIPHIRAANLKHRQEKLFLYASRDNPDGVYATAGHHLVCVTEDESRHW